MLNISVFNDGSIFLFFVLVSSSTAPIQGVVVVQNNIKCIIKERIFKRNQNQNCLLN